MRRRPDLCETGSPAKPAFIHQLSVRAHRTLRLIRASLSRSAEHDSPLLIAFDADAREAVVDGRDFLFTLFQMGDPERARPVAARLFGSAVLRYVDRAWQTNDQQERIALCRLAVQDDAVVTAHATNQAVIAGRYSTRFRSAFLVKTPIPRDRIVSVRQVHGQTHLPDPEVTLDMIRG